MIAIKAKFIGSDSLGFKHGYDYDLHIRPIQLVANDVNAMSIQPFPLNKAQACEYQSWNSFTKNWKVTDVNEADLAEGVKIFKSTYHSIFENLKSEIRNLKIIRIID
jgi:hypothetical protein